ncbi:hypothetical protein OK016_09395 [Vibrio chagasii]|nr:hypothetical protein [Vibrio chagasii]
MKKQHAAVVIALDIERKHFIKLAKSEAKALVGLFLNDQYIKVLLKSR